tara:strand:- start:302 stop:586 length:285 start_codon:yes stop_codon:yes gene_type:complete
MGAPFKMKGHTLPGPNQKKSPNKFLGLTAAAIAGIKAAMAGAAVSSAIGAGASAVSKSKANKRAEKKAASDREQQSLAKAGEMGGEIGSKTKLV